jgi:hypothetical protein
MNDETKIKLQAFLDGELSGREACQIAELLESDAEAKSFSAELQFVKTAMRGKELEIKLPETREFYWSKIQREIERGEKQESARPASFPIFAWWKPAYVRIAGGVAALCALLMVSFIAFNDGNSAKYAYVPSEIEGNGEMGAITYRSNADQMTVVYLFDREVGEVVDSETN